MDKAEDSRQRERQPCATPASDVQPALDVAATPATSQCRKDRTTALQTPSTPQECVTMVQAVEKAIQHAQHTTPDSGHAVALVPRLQEWLEASGAQLPTPAAKDLHALAAAAEDNKRLRQQIEALREAELELAAREAEENERGYAMLEEENIRLAADKAQLQQQLQKLTAAGQAPPTAGSPRTPASEHGLGGVQERAALALQRAADTSRLSGVFEEQQLASIRKLSRAEEQLSAVKAQCPGSSHSERAMMQQRLQQAQQDVQHAAAAAQQAAQELELVAAEKDRVQQELQVIRQQLDTAPNSKQHADLYRKLVEAHQQLQEEKQQHQRLTGSLLEHAGRLSHKYYNLSDDFGDLQHRYHRLASANEQLASQLKEAHEALYDMQAAVQATPPAKRQQQRQLMARAEGAEQAVLSLATEKSQLQQRLLQAQAFIACLQQRPGASTRGQQQRQQPLLLTATPTTCSSAAAATPAGQASTEFAAAAPAAAAATAATATSTSAAAAAGAPPEEFGGLVTPVKGRSNPLFDLPATPAAGAHAASALAAIAHAAVFAVDPVSPILAAAAKAANSGAGQQQQQQQIQWTAACHELQDVQHEQLGLRQEILRAKSALADIAGELRASIGGGAPAAAAALLPGAARSTASSSSAARSAGSVKPAAAAAAPAASSTRSVRPTGLAASRSSGSSSKGSAGSRGSADAAHSGSRGSKPLRVPEAPVLAAAAAQPQSSAQPVPSGCHSAGGQRSEQLQAPSSAASAAAGPGARRLRPAGFNDFVFPRLDSSSEQPRALRPAAGYAAAASPCESTGSIGSSTSRGKREDAVPAAAFSVQRSQQHQAPRTANIARIRDGGATDAASAGATEAGGAVGGSGVQPGQSQGQASSGSYSLSLDQLIADGESVSLEYGMSPGPGSGLQDTAATTAVDAPVGYNLHFTGPQLQQQPADAAAAAAALAQAFAASVPAMAQQQQQQQQQGSPVTPCMTAASSKGPQTSDSNTTFSIDWLLQQQQAAEQLAFERLAGCLADTPGSAQSSAGGAGDAGIMHRHMLQQQQQQQALLAARAVYGTPSGLSAEVMRCSDAADMQSVARPAAGGRPAAGAAAAADSGPLRTQPAATPMGAERVVSNVLGSGHAGSEASPQARSMQQQQQQQRSLLTPSFMTPTEVMNQRAMAAFGMPWSPATEDTATSAATQQQQQQHELQPGQAAADAAGVDVPVAQQWLLQTPHTAHASTAAAAAAAESYTAASSSSCTASGWAAEPAAQPGADSPVAPVATPAGAATSSSSAAAADGSGPSPLQLAASALLASISPAGLISPGEVLPAAALRHMTPEWLRDLKRRCAEKTVHVAELRRELGLATPEAANATHVTASDKTPDPQQQQGPAVPAGSSAEGGVGAQQGPASSQGRGGRWAAATPAAAAATAAGEGAGAVAHPASAASARSSIDKLRRRAIAQSVAASSVAAAAAASAAPATPGSASTAEGAAAAEMCSVSQAESAAMAAALGGAEGGSELERCDSSGSLAKYMMQQEQTALQQALSGDVSRSSSRSNSIQGYKALPRPDCPTPGSAYSVAGDAADTADGGGEAASPDTGLLEGLSSSRILARHLQQQLQQHLDRTGVMPPMQQDGGLQLSRDVAEQEQASDYSSGSSCSSSNLEGLGAAAAAAAAGAAATAVLMAFPETAQPEVTPQKASAYVCQQQQQQSAAASPFTPGAMLNAGAESRLLSPSTDLQHVFDDAQGGSTLLPAAELAAAGAAHPAAGDPAGHALQDGRVVAQGAVGEAVVGAEGQAALSSAGQQAAESLRAHQLTSLSAGTFTATPRAVAASSSSSRASDARGALQPTASTATTALAAPAASTGGVSSALQVGSEACSNSTAADASLSSWAGAAAPSSVTPAGAATGSSCGGTPAGGLAASAACAAAADDSVSGACSSSSIDTRAAPARIRLGDSPTTCRQHRTTPADAAAEAAGEAGSSSSLQLAAPRQGSAGGRQSAAACSVADTPSSHLRPLAMPGLRLGHSPEPCREETPSISSRDDSAVQTAALHGAQATAAAADAAPARAVQPQQQPAESEVSAAMPAASAAAAAAAGSSMYATPAVAFESPGTSSAAAPSAQPLFYTAMQHTARSAGSDSGAVGRRQAAAAAGVVSFGGFYHAVEEEPTQQDKTLTAAATETSPAASNAAKGGGSAAAQSAAQTEEHASLLQQLLASPAGSSCGSPGTWQQTPEAAAATQAGPGSCGSCCGEEAAPPAAACIAAYQAPAAVGAGGVAVMASHPVSIADTTAEDSTSAAESVMHCRATAARSRSSAPGLAADRSSCSSAVGAHNSIAGTTRAQQQQQQQQQGELMQQPGSASVVASSGSSSSSSAHAAAALAAGTHTPARSSRPSSSTASADAASAAAVQEKLMSPTLSDLGFFDEPTAADYARMQEGVQQQQPAIAAGSDLAGMTFEQRLALLCDGHGDGDQLEGFSAGACLTAVSCAGSAARDEQVELAGSHVSSNEQLLTEEHSPAGSSLAAAATQGAGGTDSSSSSGGGKPAEVAGDAAEEQQVVCRTPLLPAHLASRATQTSPALADVAAQRAWDAKDISTQVTTPALQKQQGTASSRTSSGPCPVGGRTAASFGAAAGTAAKQMQQQGCQVGGGACDVSASPVKARDQL